MKRAETPGVSVVQIRTGQADVFIRGTSPLIYNAMSEKAWHELLMPKGRKTAADKAENLKHEPKMEFRNSVYAWRDDQDHPTRLRFPSAAFRKSMGAAALDLPGMKKAQVERLVWIDEPSVDIYGIPQLFMSIVRSADMNHTPDVRTRAIVPLWCCHFTMQFVETILKSGQIAHLLGAAGILAGIGDWRQQKGGGNFGQFAVVSEEDAAMRGLMRNAGRKAQDAALADPACYDDESTKMLAWFYEELEQRKLTPAPRKVRHNGTTADAGVEA